MREDALDQAEVGKVVLDVEQRARLRGGLNLRPLDGGSLRNAVGMETFAAVLLTVNIRHKMRASLRLQTV